MDRQNSGFDNDDGMSADETGIETPPMIGQDERRMHVRAYNFWAKLLDGRSFPSIESLDVDDLGDIGQHSVLLDFTAGIENPAIGFLGAALARECELDESIQYIADVPRKSLLSRLTDHYLQIIANRAPIGFEAEFVNGRGVSILYRGVLMPFSSDDDSIDFILGVINWKQTAETALADSIAEEMATAATALPPSRPTLPAWSDGPDAVDDAMPSFRTVGGYAPESDEDSVGFDPLPSMGSLLDHLGAGFARGAPAMVESTDEDVLELGEASMATDSVDSPGSDAGLADWLASARASADVAAQASARGHTALYQAIGRAWGFACAAADSPEDYAELLDEAGIAVSPRAPLTPVVKLVFGTGYDKTRLAEYAAVLGHAADQGISPDQLTPYLSSYDGGLKGLVRDIRAAARAVRPVVDRTAEDTVALRSLPALAELDTPVGPDDAEFVVLLARRDAAGQLSVIADVDAHAALTASVMRSVARRARG
jgi:hypothetical protein